jgi:hypothetical protein
LHLLRGDLFRLSSNPSSFGQRSIC